MTMSNADREHLSALADDEPASAAELGDALDRLAEDPDWQDQFERFQLIGAAMRDELPGVVDPGLSGRIRAALADEPAPGRVTAMPAAHRAGRRGWGLRLALAASVVMAVAVVAVQTLPEVGPAAPDSDWLQADAQRPAIPAQQSPATDIPPARLTRQAPVGELDPYLVTHVEQASARGMSSVYPYARITVYRDE